MHLKVAKSDAESVRRRLMDEGALDTSIAVERAGDDVLFPLRRPFKMDGAELVEMQGRPRGRRPRTMREALEGRLTDSELELIPASYSVIGDIAVLELPPELSGKGRLIGQALLETFHAIKTVASKVGDVAGEFRVPEVEILAGERRTETLHREQGCVYKVDVARTYFSPRLGTERMRVVGKIRAGERVLVLFAGVGPYAILAAKRTNADVTAVELNPTAVEFMRWNVQKNKVRVDVVEGDAREVLPSLGKFDRIIMPLPKIADAFLDVAVRALSPGGVIHIYCFAHSGEEAQALLERAMSGLGKPTVLEAVACGGYSPCMSRYCVDFTVG